MFTKAIVLSIVDFRSLILDTLDYALVHEGISEINEIFNYILDEFDYIINEVYGVDMMIVFGNGEVHEIENAEKFLELANKYVDIESVIKEYKEYNKQQ